MAWDVFVDIAGDIDEVKVSMAFLSKEDCLIDGFAAIDGTINWHKDFLDSAHNKTSLSK